MYTINPLKRNYAIDNVDKLQVIKLSIEIANGSSLATGVSQLEFQRVISLLFQSCHTQNIY